MFITVYASSLLWSNTPIADLSTHTLPPMVSPPRREIIVGHRPAEPRPGSKGKRIYSFFSHLYRLADLPRPLYLPLNDISQPPTLAATTYYGQFEDKGNCDAKRKQLEPKICQSPSQRLRYSQ